MQHIAPATSFPKFYPKSVVSRSKQLQCAHFLARQLNLETRVGQPGRAEYERILWCLISRRSLAKASRKQREIVIRFFESELSAQRPVYGAEEHERIVNAGSVEELLA